MASVAVEHSGANNHATSGDMKHTKGDHAHGSVPSFPISVHNINSDLLKMHYAVRGDIVTRATQIQVRRMHWIILDVIHLVQMTESVARATNVPPIPL